MPHDMDESSTESPADAAAETNPPPTVTAPVESRAWRQLGSIPLYPTFLALAWAFGIFADELVDPAAIGRTVVAIIVITLAVSALLRVLAGSEPLAGGLSTLLVLVLLSSGTAAIVAAVAAASIVFVAAFHIATTRSMRIPWQRAHEFATIAGAVLLTIQVGSYAMSVWTRPVVGFNAAWSTPGATTDLPNIYLIIADGHGRLDVLRDAYGYDPTHFESALDDLAFTVANSSRANYLITSQSWHRCWWRTPALDGSRARPGSWAAVPLRGSGSQPDASLPRAPRIPDGRDPLRLRPSCGALCRRGH